MEIKLEREEDEPEETGPQKSIVKKGRNWHLLYKRGKDDTNENIGPVSYAEAKKLLKKRERSTPA